MAPDQFRPRSLSSPRSSTVPGSPEAVEEASGSPPPATRAGGGEAGAAGPSARPAVPADHARNIIARAYQDSRRMDDDLPLGSVRRNLVVASADSQ